MISKSVNCEINVSGVKVQYFPLRWDGVGEEVAENRNLQGNKSSSNLYVITVSKHDLDDT